MTIRTLGSMTLGFASALALAAAPASAQTSSSPSPAAPSAASNHRFFIRFVEDAALTPSFWLEGQGRWQTNTAGFVEDGDGSEATLFSTGGIFAMNIAEDFEFGARLALAHRDPDDGSGESGLTDTDIWGKLSIVSDPVSVSVGLLLTLPTGSEDDFLGTGETNVEFFGGLRKDWGKVTLAANAGFRVNQDADLGDLALEGQNSFLAGLGLIIPATQRLSFTIEYALESERYEGAHNDARLLGGFDWTMGEHFQIRGAAGGGLSEGAPDVDIFGSFVWIF